MAKTSTVIQIEVIANEAVIPLRGSSLRIFKTIRQCAKLGDIAPRTLYYLWHDMKDDNSVLCVRCYYSENKYIEVSASEVNDVKAFAFALREINYND
jgi:hypothetical protein